MIENTILKANRQGRKALVFAMTYKDLWAVEAAAQAGFDAISLDGEHGAFSSSDVDDIVRVANGYSMSVIARIPNIQPNTINLWLDRISRPGRRRSSWPMPAYSHLTGGAPGAVAAARNLTTRRRCRRSTAGSSASPSGPTVT